MPRPATVPISAPNRWDASGCSGTSSTSAELFAIFSRQASYQFRISPTSQHASVTLYESSRATPVAGMCLLTQQTISIDYDRLSHLLIPTHLS